MTQATIEHLNQELATAWVLGFNAKRYHWTVAGPHFRDYHLRFDELYLAVDAMVDELAERVRMLGGVPIHAPAQMTALSRVPPSDPGVSLDAAGMMREALAAEETVIAFMHEGIEAAGAAGDPGTADLLTRFVQEHQKQAWFLRAMLG
jgi:starvation-inducible DNA-binding protein